MSIENNLGISCSLGLYEQGIQNRRWRADGHPTAILPRALISSLTAGLSTDMSPLRVNPGPGVSCALVGDRYTDQIVLAASLKLRPYLVDRATRRRGPAFALSQAGDADVGFHLPLRSTRHATPMRAPVAPIPRV